MVDKVDSVDGVDRANVDVHPVQPVHPVHKFPAVDPGIRPYFALRKSTIPLIPPSVMSSMWKIPRIWLSV